MAVCTSGVEGLSVPSLSCIASLGDTSVALGVHKRLWRFLQTTWLSCNFPLAVSRKEGEGLSVPSLSCIASLGDTSVALGVHKRLWRFLRTTWLSCNFPLTVSRKQSGYDMGF
jgi:hypothetical protein